MRYSDKISRFLAGVILCCVGFSLSGCAYLQVPRIDPTGRRIFATPPISTTPRFSNEPGSRRVGDDVEVTLTPQLCVAPIGSEVVLSAGVVADDGYLRTNRRLEWSLSPEGVGHFVAVDKNGLVDMLLGDFNKPRKVDNTFAIGSTSRQYVRLDRGTPRADDDVCVLRGQGWISLTSTSEGTSRVTVLAPSVHAWGCRTRSAMVHWVDAQWSFPPPSINPAGTRHVLTTRVSRQSDQCPREGWLVRYEIVEGPAAGFAPEGATVVEVPTDAFGDASAEIFQKEAAAGTNKICIRVIRPASHGTGGRLEVGRGATTKKWSAPDVALSNTGPAEVNVGDTVNYRIVVRNPGDLPAEEVVVSEELPAGLTYLSSVPAAEQSGGVLSWQLGRLSPAVVREITLVCRAAEEGTVTACADVTAAGGLSANDCATTNVIAAPVAEVPATGEPLALEITGPETATVGEDVTFEILITNDSSRTLTGLFIKDTFEAGLKHQIEGNSIERTLTDLAPAQSHRIAITFRVVAAGKLCHTVKVTDSGGASAVKKACVTAGGGDVVVEPPSQSAISIKKRGPTSRLVGEIAEFAIDITNIGQRELTQLKVVDQYDPELEPKMATEGIKKVNGRMEWTIDSLAAGQTLSFVIQCDCKEAAASTRNRVEVTSPEGARAEDEAYLEIRQPVAQQPAKLILEVADLLDPVGLGKELTYTIRVTNDSPAAEQSLVLTAILPDGMTLVRLGTTGPGAVKHKLQQQTVTFDPVPQIGPKQTLDYRLRVLAGKPGKHKLIVEITSRNLAERLVVEETTEVFQ